MICQKMTNSLFLSDVFNHIALRKAKTLWNFGLYECNRVKITEDSRCRGTGILKLRGCLDTKCQKLRPVYSILFKSVPKTSSNLALSSPN